MIAGYNIIISMVTMLLVASAEADYYRYVTAEGQTIIVGQLNAEAIQQGYQQLGDNGRVAKVVERALTSTERRQLETENRQAEQLQIWDESLLLQYSTVADIEAAAVRAMREIDVRLGILRSSQSSLKSQLDTEQAKAAGLERHEQQVPEDLQRRINSLAIELESNGDAIAMRHQERLELEASYRHDAVRFGELKAIVKLRNTYSQ